MIQRWYTQKILVQLILAKHFGLKVLKVRDSTVTIYNSYNINSQNYITDIMKVYSCSTIPFYGLTITSNIKFIFPPTQSGL